MKLGDRSGSRAPRRSGPTRWSASRRFGGAGSLGGAAFTVITLPEVQALAGEPGQAHRHRRAGRGGRLAGRAQTARQRAGRQAVLVRTGAEDSAQRSKDLSRILKFLTIGLLVFGLVALLVGGFVIFNTFSITVAQRTREFGMLRTIGASRRQVLLGGRARGAADRDRRAPCSACSPGSGSRRC